MKKKIVSSLLALGLAVSLTACGQSGAGAAESKFTAGTYEGTGKGFGGEIKATVVLSENAIESITVVGDKETQGIGSVAVEQLPVKMVEAQAVEIDGISGASASSAGIKQAVTDALSKAGVDASTLVPVEKNEIAEVKDETIDADVVIVGAGGAGLSAAIEAKQAGANVVIVEKAAYAGGNTSRATGGMNAAETKLQAELGVEDTIEALAEQIDMDGAVLLDTVTKWNEAIASGVDEEFGRDTGMEHDISKASFYAIKIAPGVHHTMGGIEINTDAEVISTEGTPISGLFAAGEVVGGVHGGNRIGGTAVTDIVVYGRIAGMNAAAHAASLK